METFRAIGLVILIFASIVLFAFGMQSIHRHFSKKRKELGEKFANKKNKAK